MRTLLARVGLRYNGKTNDRGAQTERRGLAGPVRRLLGGYTSPAVYLFAAPQPDRWHSQELAAARLTR
jgi:hypothetical protein